MRTGMSHSDDHSGTISNKAKKDKPHRDERDGVLYTGWGLLTHPKRDDNLWRVVLDALLDERPQIGTHFFEVSAQATIAFAAEWAPVGIEVRTQLGTHEGVARRRLNTASENPRHDSIRVGTVSPDPCFNFGHFFFPSVVADPNKTN
jgi:hypothetical protein